MKIMALWMTLDEMEGASKKRNYKGRDGKYLGFFSNIGSHLGCNFATAISYKIVTVRIRQNYRIPSSVLIVDSIKRS